MMLSRGRLCAALSLQLLAIGVMTVSICSKDWVRIQGMDGLHGVTKGVNLALFIAKPPHVSISYAGTLTAAALICLSLLLLVISFCVNISTVLLSSIPREKLIKVALALNVTSVCLCMGALAIWVTVWSTHLPLDILGPKITQLVVTMHWGLYVMLGHVALSIGSSVVTSSVITRRNRVQELLRNTRSQPHLAYT